MEKVYVTGRKHKENTSSAFVSEGKRKTVKGWGGLLDEGATGLSVKARGASDKEPHGGRSGGTQADSQRGGCAARPWPLWGRRMADQVLTSPAI